MISVQMEQDVEGILLGDVEITREQVLQALSTRPELLFEALEATALPDDAWRSVEPRARELIHEISDETETRQSPYEVTVVTGRHVRFIERYLPYYVSGGQDARDSGDEIR
ncbi:hypothetical protein [Sorangium sp. So ce1153]|uniref:hypothetical protein n=1 Tax=Sorangium sp. So ce1153 TaxID=3133333 RepID=UPI003F60A2E9